MIKMMGNVVKKRCRLLCKVVELICMQKVLC